MSSILDALRKVEQEKAESAQTIDTVIDDDAAERDLIGGPLRPQGVHGPLTWSLLGGTLVLTVVVIAGMAMYMFRQPQPQVPPASVSTAPVATPAAPVPAAPPVATPLVEVAVQSQPVPEPAVAPVVATAESPAPVTAAPVQPVAVPAPVAEVEMNATTVPATAIPATVTIPQMPVEPVSSPPSTAKRAVAEKAPTEPLKEVVVVEESVSEPVPVRRATRSRETIETRIAKSDLIESTKKQQETDIPDSETNLVSSETVANTDRFGGVERVGRAQTESTSVELASAEDQRRIKVNMPRPANKQRPYDSAVINLQPVFLNETIPGTNARLVKVRPDGVEVVKEDTGKRVFVPF